MCVIPLKTMDYVEVLAAWCVRHGVALPTYEQVEGTRCVFLGKEYDVEIGGRQGMQDAAQDAYEGSGVFGKVVQVGFVPNVRRDQEVIVDLAHGPPGALNDALLASPASVQVSVFAPYNNTVAYPHTVPPTSDYNYTIYSTVHPGDEAFWARIEWYLQARTPVWQRYDTLVHVYTSVPYGNYIKSLLNDAGVRVALE
jgi:hypothetical protein